MAEAVPTPPDATPDAEETPATEWYVHLSIMTTVAEDVVRAMEVLTRAQSGLTLDGMQTSLASGVVDPAYEE